MLDPGKKHWEAVKGILRYLSGTRDMCICFGKSNSGVLGYTDSDYAGNSDKKGQPQNTFSHYMVVQYLGCLTFKNVWHYLPLR